MPKKHISNKKTSPSTKQSATLQNGNNGNGKDRIASFEQTFKRIDDTLWKDAGCSSELDYVEQTSWILFLKYLDDLEKDKATAALLSGKTYTPIIDKKYQWNVWAMPKDKEGKLDHQNALTGDDLKDFVDHKLFPHFKKFKSEAESPDTIEYKIGEIFSEIKNKIQSGYTLRGVINLVDELRFRTSAEKHEMSHLYEAKIQNMGNAGRNGGEYYTPRPLIRTIVKVVAPKIGDKIYDGALGSAGFLCEGFEYLLHSKGKPENLTSKDIEILQKRTFYGKEKKSLAYIIGIMNMILHGVEAPNILHTNTLAENLADIQEKDRYDIVMANPPFGGKERTEVQQNFPIKTGETAFLFLQHFIKILKAGGKAGVVIKNTFLSNTDNASVSLRKMLLETCNLHTVLDLPGGVFTGAGVKTVVLFFEKGAPTHKVWFYQLNLDRNLGKTNSLNENDLADFVTLSLSKSDSPNSWSVNVIDIDPKTFDLSAKNPKSIDIVSLRQPNEILDEIKRIDKASADVLNLNFSSNQIKTWDIQKLGEVLTIERGGSPRPIEKYITNSPDGINWIKISDATASDKYIYETKQKITSDGLSKTRIVNEGDFILSNSMSFGRPYIMKTTGCIHDGWLVLKQNGKKVFETEFLYYLLSSPYVFQQFNNLAAGSTVRNLNIALVSSVKVPIPPIIEQKRIVKILEEAFATISKVRNASEQKMEALEELKKSVMQKVFSGGI